MDDCKQIGELLSDYVDGELDPETRTEVDQHMRDCPPCVEFLKELKVTVEVARNCKMKDMPDEMRARLRSVLAHRMNQDG